MIPWITALAVLLGLNALAPEYSHTKKSESLGGIGLSQLADDAQIPGRITNPLVYLAPTPSDRAGSLGLASLLLCIVTRRDKLALQSLRGNVRGRAPPGKLFA
jgi:hypothetical protein